MMENLQLLPVQSLIKVTMMAVYTGAWSQASRKIVVGGWDFCG